MKIVAYADMHICHSWPLLRLEDFERVHRRIESYCLEHRPDVVLFLGDRFRARQPRDHVRAAADAALRRLADIQKAHGGMVYVVVGNHDRYAESVGSGNTYSTFPIFQDIISNVVVLDKPGTVTGSTATEGFAIHALPSGFECSPDYFEPAVGLINIFCFHGLVSGAVYDAAGSVKIADGLRMSMLDDPMWDLVLGGDVHVAQKFDLTHTVGGYVGSTLRLTEADAGDKRGFMIAEVTATQPAKVSLVEGGGPKFIKLSLSPDPSSWPTDMTGLKDAVVIATVEGPAAAVKALTDQQIREAFGEARDVKVHRKVKFEASALIPGITSASTPFQDMVAYIRSSKSGYDEDRVLGKAATAMRAENVVVRRGMF